MTTVLPIQTPSDPAQQMQVLLGLALLRDQQRAAMVRQLFGDKVPQAVKEYLEKFDAYLAASQQLQEHTNQLQAQQMRQAGGNLQFYVGIMIAAVKVGFVVGGMLLYGTPFELISFNTLLTVLFVGIGAYASWNGHLVHKAATANIAQLEPQIEPLRENAVARKSALEAAQEPARLRIPPPAP